MFADESYEFVLVFFCSCGAHERRHPRPYSIQDREVQLLKQQKIELQEQIISLDMAGHEREASWLYP